MLNFRELCIERPLGTSGNNRILKLLTDTISKYGLETVELPIECTVWDSGNSYIRQDSKKLEIFPGPFSMNLSGTFPVKCLSTIEELKSLNGFNGILVFKDELAKESIFPKNFPFYFPDEHKEIYETLEKIQPKGIAAVTGKDLSSGLNPFPLFEDANMETPTAFVSNLGTIDCTKNISIEINSGRTKAKSKQLVFRKEGTEKEIILISAHMDSKYFTSGALDNASGVYTLYETAKMLGKCKYTIEIVPFNGEDSPEVSGQQAYLQYLKENNYSIKTVINIDAPGHIGSENAFSFYNFDENKKTNLIKKYSLKEGEQWYSGDHGMFVFQEIQCIAVTSGDLFENSINLTHTKRDTPENIDIALLEKLGKTITNIVQEL